MSKQRIGIYLGIPPYVGGAFQYTQSVLAALDSLDKDGYEIYALYTEKAWASYLRQYNFRNEYIYYDRYHNIIGGALLRFFMRVNFHVARIKKVFCRVHLLSRRLDAFDLDFMIFPAQEQLSAIIRTPSIATIHDLMHRYETFPEVCGDGEYKSREYAYKNICMSANIILVDSELGKQQVIECYGTQYAKKIVVMPFTPPPYLLNDSSKDIDWDKYELPGKFIFYPAQFWKHKNHRNLLLAIDYLRRQGKFVHLVFVGSKKNAYDEVLNLIKENQLEKYVTILGYVSDDLMRGLYQKARAMIMPTFLGPTNIPPLEAMVMGCPMAVSDVYGMPEEVGDAALLFDPHNVKEIADILLRLWEDDDVCRTLIKKGFMRAKYFSQDNFNKRFSSMIE